MKQHLHNRIGNAVGQSKRKLFDSLKAGADLNRAFDLFVSEMFDLGSRLTAEQRREREPTATDVLGHVPINSTPQYENPDSATAECYECLTSENLVFDDHADGHICEECKAKRDRANQKETERQETVEAWARKAVCNCGDEEQQLGLVALLNELSPESNLAFVAMMAAFKDATQLQEKAIDALTKGARK